jgi:hypothetical protein
MKRRSLALPVWGGILFAVGAFAAAGLAGSSDNGSPTTGHITICHHTGDKARPFIVISPDASGVYDGHAGLSHQYGDDIIPAFSYVNAHGETVSFPGQNLSTLYGGVTGAVLLANGCVARAVTTTTVPGTTSTSTTTTVPSTTTTVPLTTTTVPLTTTTVVGGTTTTLVTSTTSQAPTTTAPAGGVAGTTVVGTTSAGTTTAGGVAGTTSAITTTATTTTATTTAPLTPPSTKPKAKAKPAAKAAAGAFKPPKAPASSNVGTQATPQPKLAFTP